MEKVLKHYPLETAPTYSTNEHTESTKLPLAQEVPYCGVISGKNPGGTKNWKYNHCKIAFKSNYTRIHQGQSHPQLAWALPDSAPTFLVASPAITRIFSFFCGFLGKFHRKHISCRFCHGFRFAGEVILGF